jgi:TatD DNase family protein
LEQERLFMLVDSHCHLDFPDFAAQVPELVAAMTTNGVAYALCAGVTLERLPKVLELAETYPQIFAAVGVHPDTTDGVEPDIDQLIALAAHPKVVAIGETGLDYYRLEGNLEWQRQRFRTHIRAARRIRKPLIIHTRAAASDTLTILEEEQAGEVGGVFHCFTESQEVAEAALAMGFFISFSGIVTFKNAKSIKEVAQAIPLERMLIETDAPYLAPMPHRGKVNQPAYVRHVAEEIAQLRGITVERVAEATTRNFFALFSGAKPL